jgi:hypothetical protein
LNNQPSDVFSQESTLHAENAEPITAAEASVQKTWELRSWVVHLGMVTNPYPNPEILEMGTGWVWPVHL